MVEDNKFSQYGYNHYLKAPVRPDNDVKAGSFEVPLPLMRRLVREIKKPIGVGVVFVAVVLLLSFVFVITHVLGDNDGVDTPPIIKADLRPIRSLPDDRGGMKIANSDSVMMANIDSASSDIDARVSDITLDDVEALVRKEEAINEAMEETISGIDSFSSYNDDYVGVAVFDATEDLQSLSGMDKSNEVADMGDISLKSDVEVSDIANKATSDNEAVIRKYMKSNDVLQKIGSYSPSSIEDKEFSQKAALAALVSKPKVNKIYAAATAPDTLEFVRKILDEKAKKVSDVEPAVGAAVRVDNINDSLYYVQLASITDSSKAGIEWQKMQARYDVLSGAEYRVQKALLSGGTFYRIQAGPMSKSEAVKLCDNLKAQNKAGGCLVVKQ